MLRPGRFWTIVLFTAPALIAAVCSIISSGTASTNLLDRGHGSPLPKTLMRAPGFWPRFEKGHGGSPALVWNDDDPLLPHGIAYPGQPPVLRPPGLPWVALYAPRYVGDGAIPVRIATGVVAIGTLQIDVDLNHDGRFQGNGELAYAGGPLHGASGTVRLHGLVPGKYEVRARLTVPDRAELVSAVQTLHVTPPPARRLPVSFEPNHGQADPGVLFLGRAQNQLVYITASETMLQADGTIQRFRLVGANPFAQPAGNKKLPGVSNYFIGNRPSRWRTHIEQYHEVVTPAVYPGIDLVHHSSQGRLQYDFRVAPGADPSLITLEFPDARSLTIDEDGGLVLRSQDGQELRKSAPMMYQWANGVASAARLDRGADAAPLAGERHAVKGDWLLKGGNRAGYVVHAYDAGRELVIDPIVFSTYAGGNGDDQGKGIALDGAGNIYVTGSTKSPNFPVTAGVVQATQASPTSTNGFVMKLNPTGTAVLYATYLGGAGIGVDQTLAIAVDAAGNAYVTGEADSNTFPVTPGAFQATNPGGAQNAFVSKLNPTGTSLVYSTYFGGADDEVGNAIAVDAAGNAYITGTTKSTFATFPVTPGVVQPVGGNALGDAFMAKLNPTGTALVYCTYHGGPGGSRSIGQAIVVDAAGNAHVTGVTGAAGMPVTPGAFQTSNPGGAQDGFVVKLNPTATARVYSTFLGGSANDLGFGIAVDAAGNAYVTGETSSANFPTTAGAFQSAFQGPATDVFVTKLNPLGSGLVYSTYLGTTSTDSGTGIAVDGSGNAYVTGFTRSDVFPVVNAVQPASGGPAGGRDAFVAEVNSTGTALLFSTYLGGVGIDQANGIALDGGGTIHIAGVTDGSFPTVNPVQGTYGGGTNDLFIAKMTPSATPPPTQTLYGATWDNKLITINTTTGAGTLVGPLSTNMQPGGLAFRGSKLYAWDTVASRLRELNPATAATLNTIDIGVTGNPLTDGDMAFRSDGIGFLAEGLASKLWRFDITIPSATLITSTSAALDGLAFSPTGTLYGLTEDGTQLYTINQVTGAATLVGNTGLAGQSGDGLAFDASGNLFATLGVGAPDRLYQINPATGVATLKGTITSFAEVTGIAFGPTPGVGISESGGSTNVAEGGATDTYTVVLNTAPSANVTITLNAGVQLMVVPASLTFTPANWNMPQTVTVTAVDDALVEGPHSGTITHTAASTDAAYNAIAIASVTAGITDNDSGPVPPPGPSAGAEGSHLGSNGGKPGPEGEYSLGTRSRSATLIGPLTKGPGDIRVYNVAHRPRMQAPAAEQEPGVPVWATAVSVMVVALAALLATARTLVWSEQHGPR